MSENKSFEGWCIIEQMGHKRMAGYVSEQTIGGHSFIRVDVPGPQTPMHPAPGSAPGSIVPDGGSLWAATQFITGQTIYAITPCTESLARKVAATCQPQPVTEWDLKRALPAAPSMTEPDDDLDEGEYDESEDEPAL